jgi:hypothetical protein
VKEVGEKANLHDGKKKDQFDYDDDPEFFSNGHFPETIVIKPNDPLHVLQLRGQWKGLPCPESKNKKKANWKVEC